MFKTIFIIIAICFNPKVLFGEMAIKIEEVSKHATAKDCWLVIQNKVYDISSYLPKHPASESILLKYCGKRADKGWDTKDKNKAHSKAASRLLERFQIGILIK